MSDRKTSLQLMEQVVMTAIFVLAAAMCLQAYATSYNLSRLSEFREEATSMADRIKETALAGDGFMLDGIASGENVAAYYDTDWQPCGKDGAAYLVTTRWTDPYPLPYLQLTVEISHPEGRTYVTRDIVFQIGGE